MSYQKGSVVERRVWLPDEPPRDAIIVAYSPDTGLEVASWQDHDGLNWRAQPGSRRSNRPEDWANIVEAALRYRWKLTTQQPEITVTPEEGPQ